MHKSAVSLVGPASNPASAGLEAGPTRAPSADGLLERVVEDMSRRWQQGEYPRAEAYLALHPELVEQPETALELLYEEVCLGREHGRPVSQADLARRFPQWRRQLEILFNVHHLLEGELAAPVFPAAGATLGDFRLLAELGRGAQGRVFLATQPELADRPVALKLAPCRGQEHLSLARLQHTHIVPLYSVHTFPERSLRGLCMPYFGGATLAGVLDALARIPARRRTGQQFVAALGDAQAAAPLPIPVGGPACTFLAGASYAHAMCWLGACLADALQYAREHGLVHLDLKPSNVLLAADGLPMLLDFHLARAPLAAGDPAPPWLGGTPAYMAPEQRAALDAVRGGRPLPAAVDERADVYALGVLLYEALGGTLPPATATPARTLRRHNPQVTVGLADILDRCLAQDAGQRYAGAADLAVDLRRHMDGLPLRGVANRSWVERWRKWRRRRPYTFAAFALVLALAWAGAAVWSHFDRQVRQAEAALREGTDHLRAQRHGQAIAVFQHGMALAEELPFASDVARRLGEQLHEAERGRAAQELHTFVERLRALYGDGLPAGPAAQEVEEHCRHFWEERVLIAQRLAGPVAPQVSEPIRQDLLDLAIVWTDLKVRLAGQEAAAARREALVVLEQAQALFGPSSVLYHERRAHAAALGLAEVARTAAAQAAALGPRTAWEHYAVGRALLRDGNCAGAAEHFERALALQPQALWPNFARGKCAYQQGQFEDAVVAFTACVVLAPDSAWCFANRGLAYAALGRADRALQDYDRALQLDATLAEAALNRGLLHLHEGRYSPAGADLQRALDLGANPADCHYHLACVHLAQGDRAAALADVRQALRHDPTHHDGRALLDLLRREP